MPVPVRVTAPASPVVELGDLKAALRVDDDDSDELIAAYERAAVAHLDGYRGILGRCILEQQWQVSYPAGGSYRLPFPDVTAVSAIGAGASALPAEVSQDTLGSVVTIPDAATVTLTACLPEDALDIVRQAIRMLVGHWYANREAVVTGTTATALPMAVHDLLDPIRSVMR